VAVFLVALSCISYHDLVSFAATAIAGATAGPPITDAQRAFFEAKIRPVLVKNCYTCHSASAKDIGGGLMLDTRLGLLRGGADGKVISPGNPDRSMLIKAIRYTDQDLQMPPDDGGGKLSDTVIHDFETWVKMGAPDPRDGLNVAPPPKTYDTSAAKKWWAFQWLHRPPVNHLPKTDWTRGEIDQHVLATQQAKGLKPVGDADKQTLIRRGYFDLIGLPPTPDEVDAFVKDDSPKAFEKIVDDLLARPQFGEHWGRHWLDVARYAESAGKEVNLAYPDAWRYRDYVITAFNRDTPYNQFVREQIAGDLLQATDIKKRVDQVIATGFLAIGAKGLSEQSSRQFDLDLADEQLDTTSKAFIGLTVSCARCHDHKFDPILQRDYYAMAGIFLSTKTHYGTIAGARNNQDSDLIEVPTKANLPTALKPLEPSERKQLESELADVNAQYDELLADRRADGGGRALRQQQQTAGGQNAVQKFVQIRNVLGRKAKLESVLNSYDATGKPKAFCMGVQDRPAGEGPEGPMPPLAMGPRGNVIKRQPSGFETISDSPLFFRGEVSDPRERIPRGFPVFLMHGGTESFSRSESGRKELADWIASPANPLTARVMANRIWYWLFGQGIVTTVDNFGTMGEAPTDQPLLDYLASQFIDDHWSVKKLIREIVLSHTYQLASTYDEADNTIDPQNSFMWRHSKLRLNAECIRDAMLASSGDLNLDPPVGSSVAVAGDGSIGSGPPYERIDDEQFVAATGSCRSVYLPVPRDAIPDSLAVFDYPDSTEVNGAREVTNVPSQALYLLNGDFVRGQAGKLAQRLLAALPDTDATDGMELRQNRVNLAFRLVLGRAANAIEQDSATRYFVRMLNDRSVNKFGVWSDFCLALYNTAEFRSLN
jgi:hypothetical protein